MNIEFTVPEVAAKYSTTRTTDPKIHLPGKGSTGWGGKLSMITLAAADKLFADKKQNLIQLKPIADKKEIKPQAPLPATDHKD